MAKKRTVAFDLETIADTSVIPMLPDIEPAANLKDPQKIQEDIAKKKAKQLYDLGLNPATSLIACFGWCDENGSHALLLDDEDKEGILLQKIWGALQNYDHFVSFNGIAFDVPILRMHSLKKQVRPSIQISTKKYVIENHTDIRAVLGNWDTFAKGNLDFYSKILLGKTSKGEMSGDQVQGYWDMGMKNEIAEYCRGDCEITMELFELVQKYYLF